MRLYQKGLGGFKKFEGSRYQRGNGWGDFLGRVYKFIKPRLFKAGKYITKQAIDTGIKVGRDVLEGRKIKESIKNRGKQKAEQLIKDFEDNVNQAGFGHGQLPTAESIKVNKSLPIATKSIDIHNPSLLKRKFKTSARNRKHKRLKKELVKTLLSNL